MSLSKVKLPSNKKFGFFFSAVFFIVSFYFIYSNNSTTGYILAFIGTLFLIVTTLKAELLLPLNILWMRFGQFLGVIISPIILGIIFFGLITPYSVIIKLVGRDELKLKKIKTHSHWIVRSQKSSQTDFKQQF